MKREELDRWAAQHIGEGEDESDFAVTSRWYTSSPGAAFVVLAKCADEGMKVELTIADGKASVECGEGESSGVVDNLAQIIVEACYKACNGMQEKVEDDGDDTGE
jgi:hypothetical protein